MTPTSISGTVPTRFDNMNLMDAAQMILTERGMLLDNQLKMQIEAIDQKNAQLKEANDALVKAMAAKASNDGKTPMPDDLVKFFKDNGISNPVAVKPGDPEMNKILELISRATSDKSLAQRNKDLPGWNQIGRHMSPEIVRYLEANGYKMGQPPLKPDGYWDGRDDYGRGEVGNHPAFKAEKWGEIIQILQTIAQNPKPDMSSGKWDAVIKSIQGQADSLSSQSQMDMTRLQSLMGKNNNNWEQLSNMQNKILQNLGSIIRNI
jgi:hypothetical protein